MTPIVKYLNRISARHDCALAIGDRVAATNPASIRKSPSATAELQTDHYLDGYRVEILEMG